MVIGECMLDRVDTGAAQLVEESCGIADAGDRMHALAGKIAQLSPAPT